MKKIAANILATTGLSLILLAVIAVCCHAEFLCVGTIFEVLAVNAAIHMALQIVRQMELRSAALEIVTELVLTVGLMLAFGKFFQWFASTPFPVLVLIGTAVYGISLFLNLLHTKREAEEMNGLIERAGQR